MLRGIWILLVIILSSFKMNMASFHRDCVEYAKNRTICTTLEACKTSKCESDNCQSIPAAHFRNIAVVLNKRLRNKPDLKEQLNPLLHDPLRTSIFTQQALGAFCGQENNLLQNVKIKVMLSEGILQQLLRKASILQHRYLYARNDCLNKCNILGINLDCELVPGDDMEIIKTAAFKHLQHMIFFQCAEFPMLLIITVTLIVVLTIVTIMELAMAISRIHETRKMSKRRNNDKQTTDTLSMSKTKSQMASKSTSNESTNLSRT